MQCHVPFPDGCLIVSGREDAPDRSVGTIVETVNEPIDVD
jgi:hypothetical protein